MVSYLDSRCSCAFHMVSRLAFSFLKIKQTTETLLLKEKPKRQKRLMRSEINATRLMQYRITVCAIECMNVTKTNITADWQLIL